MNQRYKSVVSCVGLTFGLYGLALLGSSAVRAQAPREIPVTGNNFAFSPASITVQKDEIVKITFSASDIPHSFTIDRYRISKRAAAGQSVTFEFRADQAGTFDFYCNLTQDDRCRNMKGQFVVH
jgi:heme/copper-type cytochrome/quinol oxidase subunit 2